MARHLYDVFVGNIGYAHQGTLKKEAITHYNDYVQQSRDIPGARCYGQDVTLMRDGEPLIEYLGHISSPPVLQPRHVVKLIGDALKLGKQYSVKCPFTTIETITGPDGQPQLVLSTGTDTGAQTWIIHPESIREKTGNEGAN